MDRMNVLSIGALAVSVVAGSAMAQVRVRAVHASPDAPAVNVIGSGGVLGAGTNVFPNLSFTQASAYAPLPNGTYTVGVAAAPSTTTIYSESFDLTGPADVTVVARGLLGGTGGTAFDLLPFVDDNTSIAGQARVRFIHASPNAPLVDITLPGGSNLFNDVAFGTSGGYITVPAGNYTLQVRLASNQDLVLSTNVSLAGGSVSTIFAMGLVGGTGLQALSAVPVIDVVPTPAAAALLGLGGLAAARRRR